MVVNPTRTKNFLYKKKYPVALPRGFFIEIGSNSQFKIFTQKAVQRLGKKEKLNAKRAVFLP
jgi:hypothetical protein